MNILYLGAESANWIISLCNEFCNLGHNVTCLVQTADEYDAEHPVIEHKNLKRINLKFEEFFNPNIVKSKLLVDLQSKKYDLVFGSHAPISPVVSEVAKMLNLPWGIMLLDIPTDKMQVERDRMRQWLYWFDILKYADIMLFNTYVARDEYYKYTHQMFPDTCVIPYGINTIDKYDNAGKTIKGDYVVSAFRFTDVKNASMIAEALSFMDKPLKYVGIGRARENLEKTYNICKRNGVEFIHYPMVSEETKFELIKNSSMLIYPQITEYIGGLSPFEGMFCGKPVIVCDYKVLRDLYGQNATYIKPNSYELYKEISSIHNMKREILYKRLDSANKYAKEFASFSNMAKEMNEIFIRMVRQ